MEFALMRQGVLVLLAFYVVSRTGLAFGQSIDTSIGDPRNGLPDNPANINSSSANISANGRFVTFYCYASNVVANDTNGEADVFVMDRCSGTVSRVSVSSSGVQANGASLSPSISQNGRYVVFQSLATNLVSGDNNNNADIFMNDRATGITTRVSEGILGAESNGVSAEPMISANGRYVAFSSTANNLTLLDLNNSSDVFVRDMQTGITACVSLNMLGLPANNYSEDPSISADGRFIAFESLASDLVPGDTNTNWDVFVRDTVLGTTERVSVASDGTQANGFCTDASISGDGRFVTYMSAATNLVPNDTNGKWDIFMYDRQTHTTTRVSTGNGNVQGNGSSNSPQISGDGHFVVFRSYSNNLVPGDTNNKSDVFIRDLTTGVVTMASVNDGNTQGNDNSYEATLSLDGHLAAFISQATNLDPQAVDAQVYRVFVRGPAAGLAGDINGDGVVDGKDIQAYVALAMSNPQDMPSQTALDVDGNGVVNSDDTVAMVRKLLNMP